MKVAIFIICIFSSALNAQSVIFDIKESGHGKATGYYRKDIFNLLNQFEGTYIYTNGNKFFKIVLEKKLMQSNLDYYEDMILGEYQYIENGVEKVNTLTNLNISYNNQFLNHNIAGNSILYKTVGRIWNCPECNPGERRLRSRILDKNTGRAADFFMRRTVINGQQVLQVKIDNISPDFESANPSDFSLPTGEFTMVKQ
ncbi:MAG TPA: DUF6705 family protein [Chryseobacterium sp.]